MNSQFIEVGIGLVFIYLLMAIMVSAVNEIVMSIFAPRGPYMKAALREALDDPLNKHWAQLVYDHPLIDKLKRNEKRPPAYISSSTFALALIEVIANEGREDHFEVRGDETIYVDKTKELPQFDRFCKGLSTLKESHVKNVLRSFVHDSNGDYLKLKFCIENWFNEYMDRVGGWYKRKSKRCIFWIAVTLTVVLNVNTINLSVRLWNNAILRETLVSAAETYVDRNKEKAIPESSVNSNTIPSDTSKRDTSSVNQKSLLVINSTQAVQQTGSGIEEQVNEIRTAYDELEMLNLPIGWNFDEEVQEINDSLAKPHSGGSAAGDGESGKIREPGSTETAEEKSSFSWSSFTLMAYSLLGWFFTAIAVSYGAPFWFDLLNKLINLRATGKETKK